MIEFLFGLLVGGISGMFVMWAIMVDIVKRHLTKEADGQ